MTIAFLVALGLAAMLFCLSVSKKDVFDAMKKLEREELSRFLAMPRLIGAPK